MHKGHLRIAASVLGVAFVVMCAIPSSAQGQCLCMHCGRQATCQKVCRLVCEDKKVEVVCYGCLCEPFCVPGPSCPSCEHCESVCASCDVKGDGKTPYAAAQPFVWKEWIPNPFATVFTKKKLMKKTETVTVKSYKWVVEDCCATCDVAVLGADIEPGADVPPPPPANMFARLKVGVVRPVSAVSESK